MSKVEIYSKDYCPYCKAAKHLLNTLNWQFNEFEVTNNPKLKAEMLQRAQRKTVPQIFIDNQHIGGFEDFRNYVQQQDNESTSL